MKLIFGLKNMSNKSKPNYIIREFVSSDCEEVHQILTEVNFLIHNYRLKIFLDIDPEGTYVAQELNSGIL